MSSLENLAFMDRTHKLRLIVISVPIEAPIRRTDNPFCLVSATDFCASMHFDLVISTPSTASEEHMLDAIRVGALQFVRTMGIASDAMATVRYETVIDGFVSTVSEIIQRRWSS